MDSVSGEVLAAALDNATQKFRDNPSWDLFRALAEATTTAQCHGTPGFAVFRDIRKAVSEQIKPMDLVEFNDTASRNKVVDVLGQCRKRVTA